MPGPAVVVTLWRNKKELLDVRQKLYQRGEFEADDQREDAVNQVLAWRVRSPEVPLALESTADLVSVVAHDEKKDVPHSSMRLLYAGAISRFVTGVCDSHNVVEVDLPPALVAIRHEIVHRHMPGLESLRLAAKTSLQWLWEVYWESLDPEPEVASAQPVVADVQTELQRILKTFLSERKDEVKELFKARGSKRKELEGSHKACAQTVPLIVRRCQGNQINLEILANILVDQKMIVPAGKGIAVQMDGAFLIWTSLIHGVAKHQLRFLDILLDRMMAYLNSGNGVFACKAFQAWLVHILTSDDGLMGWNKTTSTQAALERTLSQCLAAPTQANLGLAQALVEVLSSTKTAQDNTDVTASTAARNGKDREEVAKRKLHLFEAWNPVLEAALGTRLTTEDQDIVMEEVAPDIDKSALETFPDPSGVPTMPDNDAQPLKASSSSEQLAKGNGWEKHIGRWRRQPIGAVTPSKETGE